ncbi:MAG: hypothetical protein WAT39_15890 [Planctomycetota bacterium]
MTRNPPPAPAPLPPGSAAGGELGSALLRAYGVAVAVVLVAGVVAAGVAFGTGLLPTELWPWCALGLLAALFAGMLALFLHGRFLDPRTAAPFARDGRLLGSRLQALLAAAFAAKVGVLVLGIVALRLAGVKFAALAGFAVTFAACALLCQLTTAMALVRGVKHRGAGPRPGAAAPEGLAP